MTNANTETKRDLHADLAICERATKGPLYVADVPNGIYVIEENGDVFAECELLEDARFIAEAREGWPHAIRRAIAAEKMVEVLSRQIGTENGKLLERAKEAEARVAELEAEVERLKRQLRLTLAINKFNDSRAILYSLSTLSDGGGRDK